MKRRFSSLVMVFITALLAVLLPASPAAAAPPKVCNGLPVVLYEIFGTPTDGDDSIVGAEFNTDIVALGSGNDVYRDARESHTASDDVICGNQGNDKIKTGFGDNTLLGGAGNDYLEGGEYTDLLLGGSGQDTLYGDHFIDPDPYPTSFCGGWDGNDQLFGGPGVDWLFGCFGDDLLDGGDGEDLLEGSNGTDDLRGGNNADTLKGGEGADTLDGGPGNDTCIDPDPGTVFVNCEVIPPG